jgi:hypothetical protein
MIIKVSPIIHNNTAQERKFNGGNQLNKTTSSNKSYIVSQKDFLESPFFQIYDAIINIFINITAFVKWWLFLRGI